jgi:catechol 2,3-dioxygenase-like lactoylglutathione lyase family enzyme
VDDDQVAIFSRLSKEAMNLENSRFRMGRLDHVHIRVPDRAEAARWYAQHLGFEPVEAYAFWANGFDGGPLQISADGGNTTLALFEVTEDHPMAPQSNGIAFNVDAATFITFARSLPCGIDTPAGTPLTVSDLIDFDLCWAFDLADPWGNQYELNCYDYGHVNSELVEVDHLTPIRFWPRDTYPAYIASSLAERGLRRTEEPRR